MDSHPKYCRYCGSQLIRIGHPTCTFDEQTGARLEMAAWTAYCPKGTEPITDQSHPGESRWAALREQQLHTRAAWTEPRPNPA